MLKQKFLVQFGSNIGLRILGIISGIVVARIAGPEVLGTVAFGTAYVSIFGFITGLFGTSHIKLISEGRDLGKCVSTYTRLQSGALLLYLTVVFGWFLFQKEVLNHSFESKIHETVVIISMVMLFFTKFVDFNNSTFTAQLKQFKANYPHFLMGVLFQLGKIGVVLLGFRAIGLVSWNLISTLIILPFAYYLYKSLPKAKFDYALAKEYCKIALPVFLIVVLNSLIGYSDKLLLHHYTNSIELGYYVAAFSLGGMILIVGNSIGTIFFPLFSKLIKENNWASVNDRIGKFELFLATMLFPGIVLVVFISQPLITLVLGSKYQNSIVPFQILLFASYVSIVGLPYGNIISGMGRFYLNFWLKLSKFVIYIVTAIFLISPKFLGLGAIGLAITLLSVNVINNVLIFFTSKKIGSITMNSRNFIIYAVISLISIGCYFLIPIFIRIGNSWWLLFSLLYIFLVYGVLALMQLVGRKDLITLANLLNPSKTVEYMKKERNED